MSDWKPREKYFLAEDTITKEDIMELARWLGCHLDEGDDSCKPWTGPIPRLTQGPMVKKFEEAFAKEVGSKHALFVNSGSSANLLAWDLAGSAALVAREGEEVDGEDPRLKVVVPAVAWATSVSPAMKFGHLRPLLCEADEDTWGLDPKDLRRLCQEYRPAVVLLVHVLGVPCDMDEIAKLKREFGFYLIEDACGAFGSKPVGELGELTTFSTYYGHQLATIEGGFVCSHDDDSMLRMLRSHGWAVDVEEEARKKLAAGAKVDPFRERFTFHVAGYNLRGDDLRAHLGLSQLARAAATTQARHRNHGLYLERFAAAKGFTTQYRSGDRIASIGYGVLASSVDHRNRIAAALQEKGIETRPIAGGNMARQPMWYSAYGEAKRKRPMADRIHDCGFQLPNHPGLAPEDVGYIADTVLAVKP